jgi:ferrochelatase
MKTAIILFNLGGPDRTESVEPFLKNLFSDKRIIGLPQPIRGVLAHVISKKRGPTARGIYAHLGGGSPLLENTKAQGIALEADLNRISAGEKENEFRCFISMRYWHPRALETAMQVGEYMPDRIVLLPLYPQYSTTSSGSSLEDWEKAAKRVGLNAPTTTVCCYPVLPGFIEAVAHLTDEAVAAASHAGLPRVLFSAHGLPERIIDRGDPYQSQCVATAAAIAGAMQHSPEWRNTYQSRVGPLKWIGPATDDEIELAGAEKRPLVVVPIAFVSEHSETLVELDIEYRHLAERAGVPLYLRVPAVGAHPRFITGLAGLVRKALAADRAMISGCEGKCCDPKWEKCPLN